MLHQHVDDFISEEYEIIFNSSVKKSLPDNFMEGW